MKQSLLPTSSLESAEVAPPTFGTRPIVLVLPSENHVGRVALAIQKSGMPCLLAFDKETLDYWRRQSQYAAFVVDLGSSWIKRAAEDLVDRGAWVVGLSDDDEERWRALTRGFKDAFSFTTPAREIAVKLKAKIVSREVPVADILDTTGPITIDPGERRACWNGEEVPLSRILFDLLSYLMARPRSPVPVQQLLEDVWREPWGHPSKVHKAMGRLREALGPDSAAHIRSKRGHGYVYFPD